jgi:endoribonuclease Dicer
VLSHARVRDIVRWIAARSDKATVVCHDIILASAEDPSTPFAARKASFLALDALEGDIDFLTRTCSCRSLNEAKKAAKKAIAKYQAEFNDVDADAEMRLVEEMALGVDEITRNASES